VTVTASTERLPVKVCRGDAAAVPVALMQVVVLIVQGGALKVTVGVPV
jgi:hypothetical protein